VYAAADPPSVTLIPKITSIVTIVSGPISIWLCIGAVHIQEDLLILLPLELLPKKKSCAFSIRCHAHGLIAKVPHSRRWRVTRLGRIAMAASIQLRDIQFPAAHMKLAS